jgi:uncharacterized protein (DUF952 family)
LVTGVSGQNPGGDAIIVHIVSPADWQRGQRDGAYHGDTLATDGFIHFSKPEQVLAVAHLFFSGQRGLLLVVVDAARVRAPIRYEGALGGDQFPHIYGPLNFDSVRSIEPLELAPDGTFTLPAALEGFLRGMSGPLIDQR